MFNVWIKWGLIGLFALGVIVNAYHGGMIRAGKKVESKNWEAQIGASMLNGIIVLILLL